MPEGPEEEIIRKDLDTDAENPAVEVAACVAEIEDTDTADLSTMYDCVDGVLDNLFSQPPDPDAQMQVKFSYETYRITIDQDGTAKFVKTD